MALTVGSHLGHYEVTALIGEGGMGQVYQATDTKLKRQVALKILPDAFSADPERLARFQREAEVLASLNHPNIAAIHGLEEADDIRALVLELVEGPTLADRIKQGPIPLDEALPIAKQIAEALEAAHEAGVIHRDLKPANIKVKDDGTVKVLDFGLAKALDPNPTGDPSQSPTLTAAATQMGVIMGTAAYMSPEQAAGQTADKRSDLWSFGVVLYEMLTGQRLFTGETVSHVLAKVLERDIDFSVLPTPTPAPIRRLLRRCLERKPKRRLSDVGEALSHLEEAATAPTEEPSGTPLAPVVQPAGWRQALPWALGALVLGGIVVGFAVWTLTRQPDLPTDILRIGLAGPEIAPGGGGVDLAISSDGNQIVYRGPRADGGGGQLHLRALDQLDGAPLRGTERALTAFFSPNGEWVGFAVEAGGHVQRVSVFGGQPETIARLPLTFSGASWGADDRVILGLSGAGLHRVPAAGGELEVLTTPDEERGYTSHLWPSIIPNAQAVLFAATRPGGGPAGLAVTGSQLAVLDLETGEVTELGLAGTAPRYVATGHLVYATDDGEVRAAPFDPGQLTVTGSPVTLVEGVMVKPTGAANVGVSDAGRLVYMTGTVRGGRRSLLVWVDRNGETTSVIGDETFFGAYPRLSPDGNRVALASDGDIWILDLERGSNTRLTEEGGHLYPMWGADGAAVTFASNRAGSYDIYSRPADQSGPAELLVAAPEILVPGSWSPDGRTLVFRENNADTGRDLWVLVDGTPSPFFVTEFNEATPRLSPDGQWVAYMSDQAGENRIYVQPFPEGGNVIPVSTEGGTEPVWSRDGRELFYRNGTQMMVVAVEPGSELMVGRPSLLFEGLYRRNNLGTPNYDVFPDGQRFLMLTDPVRTSEDTTAPQIILVQNWFEELTRLVPVP